jgi:hypothetical protein
MKAWQTWSKISFADGTKSFNAGWFKMIPHPQWFLIGDTSSFNVPDNGNEGHSISNTNENIVPGVDRTITVGGTGTFVYGTFDSNNYDRPVSLPYDNPETYYNTPIVGYSPRYYDFPETTCSDYSDENWISRSPREFVFGGDDMTEDLWDEHSRRMKLYCNPSHITPKDEDMLKVAKPMLATLLPGQDTGLCY